MKRKRVVVCSIMNYFQKVKIYLAFYKKMFITGTNSEFPSKSTTNENFGALRKISEVAEDITSNMKRGSKMYAEIGGF